MCSFNKDEKERSELYADLRGHITKQRDGYTGENEYMQMLADMGAATGTNSDIEITVKTEQDIMYFKDIKDEKERVNMFADNRGCTATERLGFAAPKEQMQMLADMAARAGAESLAQNVIPQ